MRWLAVWGFLACISSLAAAAEPAAEQGLSADQIVEKNIAARGGLDAWRKIQTMVWVGHIEGATPVLDMPFALLQKRPNKTHFEIQAQNRISLRVYDGAHGWKLRPTGSGKPELQPFTAEELSFAHDGQGIDGPLMDYQTKGVVVALDGIDEVEGHKAYRLNVKLPSGASHHVWIDAKTFLDVKYDRESRNSFGMSGRLSVFYRNYKTIDGVQIPLMIESGGDNGKGTEKMVIDKVLLNPPLQDRLFAKPNIPGLSNAASAGRPVQARAGRFVRPRSPSGPGEAP